MSQLSDQEKTSGDLSVDSSWLVSSTVILTGLVIISFLLYFVDRWITERVDGYLLRQYGADLYDRYTRVYDPAPGWSEVESRIGKNGEERWTVEDEIIKELLIAQ